MTFLCYSKCSTCKKAQKWLEQRGAAYTERPIKEERPSADELRAWQKASGLPLKKVFQHLWPVLQSAAAEGQASRHERGRAACASGYRRDACQASHPDWGRVCAGGLSRSGVGANRIKTNYAEKRPESCMAFRSFFQNGVLCAVTKRSFLRLQSRGRRERPWSIQNFRRCTGAGIVPCCCMRAPDRRSGYGRGSGSECFCQGAAVLSRRRQCARLVGDECCAMSF